MNISKTLLTSRIIHDGRCGTGSIHHIRYDIHTELLRELFEDEEKLEKFAEEIKRDVLYRLGKLVKIEQYCQTDKALVKEILEKIKKGEL